MVGGGRKYRFCRRRQKVDGASTNRQKISRYSKQIWKIGKKENRTRTVFGGWLLFISPRCKWGREGIGEEEEEEEEGFKQTI